MTRYLEITLETGSKILATIDYLPINWTEKQVQAEFAEYLILLLMMGEKTALVGHGIEVPIKEIEDFRLVEM